MIHNKPIINRNSDNGRIAFMVIDDDDKLLLWYGWPTKGV